MSALLRPLRVARLREVVRHLRKRLQMKASRVVMNSLTLTETLVMNCHTRFHNEVATEKFMEAVARVARVRLALRSPPHKVSPFEN
jgi:hypothetical protein